MLPAKWYMTYSIFYRFVLHMCRIKPVSFPFVSGLQQKNLHSNAVRVNIPVVGRPGYHSHPVYNRAEILVLLKE